jgi:hypothetical protein
MEGMMISGFIVRADLIIYGLFPTYEAAQAWADVMTVDTVIEPVYVPTFNRG